MDISLITKHLNNGVWKGLTRSERTIAAVAQLEVALKDGVIYNARFNDAKDIIDSACEKAMDKLSSEYRVTRLRSYGVENMWDLPRDAPDSEFAYEITSYVRPNDAASKLKAIEKAAKSVARNLLVPEYHAYVETLKVMVEIRDLYKAVKPIIIKGKPKAEPKIEDLTNTGVCAICGGRFKLRDGRMVQHGFQISNGNGDYIGYRDGKCFGQDYKCYEFSNEANLAFRGVLAADLSYSEAGLTAYRSGVHTEFAITVHKKVGPGRYEDVVRILHKSEEPVKFQQELESRIHKLEWHIDGVNREIAKNEAKIADWTLQPLMYGGKDGK